jgi:hypothetical protein
LGPKAPKGVNYWALKKEEEEEERRQRQAMYGRTMIKDISAAHLSGHT